MACLRIHDFIRGTTIALPVGEIGNPKGDAPWDVLRPNAIASALVLRHVEALDGFAARPELEEDSPQ